MCYLAAPLKDFENRCEFFTVAEHLAVQVLRDTIEGVWFVLGFCSGAQAGNASLLWFV